MEIPKYCKAGVCINEGPDFHLEVQDVPVPEPGPGELLFKLNITGLCGSDIHYMTTDLGMKMSTFNVRCAGHEGAGIVAALGPNVSGWSIGDRAGVKPIYDYCAKAVHFGLMKNGSYQQYVVSPAIYTSRIPDGVSDEVAGPVMCSASTMHRALVDSGLKAGEWVVFPGGGGGVGMQGIQLAKTMGMRPMVVDSGEKQRKLALDLGAEEFIDFKEVVDVARRIKEIADGMARTEFS